ncbi:MAG: TIM barrel protein [Eubacteriales bacterium]|nr:TIM barrel protein [Eubacteriales bacterium]
MAKIKAGVSLYSLQDQYLTKKMSLEDILHYVKDCGAEGVEILPDQMLKGAPEISDELLADWKRMIAETGLEPVISDVFLNTNLYKNRTLTKRECIDLLIKEIQLANKLGMKLIRLVSMVPAWVIEPLLPYCEKYDVTIAIEIHAGMAFDVQATNEFISEVKRLNSRYAGLVIDTGIFCRRFPRVIREYEINNGASKEMFDFCDALFEKGTDLHAESIRNGGKLPEEFLATWKTHEDQLFGPLCDGYESYPFEVMDDLLPYIKHFHMKMFEMTPEGPEYSIDFKGLVQYLHDHNYEGYLCTEYEGNRFTLPGKPTVEREQVAMNMKYIRKCIDEICG